MNIEIVYQETKNGDRMMDIMYDGERVATLSNVTNKRIVEKMVSSFNAIHAVLRNTELDMI